MEFEGGSGDKLFYVDESSPSAPILRLMSTVDMSVGSGGEWSFIDFFKEDGSDSYYAIGTNEVGKPFTIQKDGSGNPVAQLLNVRNEVGPDKYMFGVRAMTVYNGAVIYGGYFMGNEDGTGVEDYSNFIAFSAPGEPTKIVETDGETSDIRIGASPFEPVTALAVNSVSTDTLGIKGQLVVFTTRRVITYDGLPPVSGNPTGTAFHSVALGDVGCVAQKTVVKTPAGLLFLGTDGLVYLIPVFSSGGPIPVSRTVERALAHMSQQTQRQCAATYDDGHYKLSYPETNFSATAAAATQKSLAISLDRGSPQATIPNRQLWLDLRQPLDPSQVDFGLVWSGPHEGMKYSCFANANQMNDHGILFAGSAIDGTVFQTSLEGVYSDPSPETPGTTVPLAYDVQTGQFDAGDIHLDKFIQSIQWGVNVNRAVTITSSIITSGDVTNAEEGENFSNAVSSVGYLFSQALTIANVPAIAPADSFRLISNHPSTPQRGRTFRFRFQTTPSAATRIKLSDLAFVMGVAKRRE